MVFLKTFLFEKVVEIGQEKVVAEVANDNAAVINIEDEKDFNCINMNNPLSSDCICVINNIKLDLKAGNKLYLIPEELDFNDDPSVRYGKLNILCSYKLEDNYDNVINDIEVKDKHFDILKRQYVILIPGGSLCIKLRDAVKKVGLKINWIEEKL